MPQQFTQNPLNQFESENLPVGWPWQFFSVSLIIFLTSLLIFLGLTLGYGPYLRSQILETDDKINQLLETVSKKDQERFAQFYSQLVNLKNLLDNHILSSKVLPWLEKITNQKVYYTNATIKVPEHKLELEGIAESYGVLGEQLEAFNQTEGISHLLLKACQ